VFGNVGYRKMVVNCHSFGYIYTADSKNYTGKYTTIYWDFFIKTGHPVRVMYWFNLM